MYYYNPIEDSGSILLRTKTIIQRNLDIEDPNMELGVKEYHMYTKSNLSIRMMSICNRSFTDKLTSDSLTWTTFIKFFRVLEYIGVRDVKFVAEIGTNRYVIKLPPDVEGKHIGHVLRDMYLLINDRTGYTRLELRDSILLLLRHISEEDEYYKLPKKASTKLSDLGRETLSWKNFVLYIESIREFETKLYVEYTYINDSFRTAMK